MEVVGHVESNSSLTLYERRDCGRARTGLLSFEPSASGACLVSRLTNAFRCQPVDLQIT